MAKVFRKFGVDVVSNIFITVNYRYKHTAYYTVVIITGIKSVVEKGMSL
jgi:hypothetical protein